MKPSLLLLALFFTSYSVIHAQVGQQWATPYNGPGGLGDEGKAIAVDGNGNTYVTGRATNASGNYDYATIKYNSTGVQQWVVLRNGTYNTDDIARAIAVDAAGNVYVTGKAHNGNTDYDMVTVKYNTNGVEQWAATFNSAAWSEDDGAAIVVDGAGNVYVAGVTSAGFPWTRYITVKYNSGGVQQWANQYGGYWLPIDKATDVEVDGTGNVYVTGTSRNSNYDYDIATIKYNAAGVQQWVAVYDAGPGYSDGGAALDLDAANNVIVTGYTSAASLDYITIKYNSAGVQQWATTYDGPGYGNDFATDVVVDSTNSIIVTGYAVDATQGVNYVTVKYNSSGVQQWATSLNGTGNSDDYAQKICADNANNIYVIGYTTNASLDNDYTTVKYNTAGTEQWRISYNGTGNDDDYGAAITVDASANVYVTGRSLVSGTNYNYVTIKYSQSQFQTNVTCVGSCNGSATIVTSGGNPPYTYSWAPSGGTAATATGLCPGSYTCTITDAVMSTTAYTFNITEPAAAVSGATVVTNVTCFGGSNGAINLTPSGGTGPYTYAWNTGQTTEDRTGLSVGSYTVTITDANGCTATVSATITQPTAITPNPMQNNITCNGGVNSHMMVAPTGGASSYTYAWAPVSSSINQLNGVPAGTYTCTITDANGCIATQAFNLTQPSPLVVTSTHTNTTCSGSCDGVITISASGSNGGYTYAWAPSAPAAPSVSGLCAGSYTCTVTDVMGCTSMLATTVTQPSALTVTSSVVPVLCYGDSTSVTVRASGGTAPYTGTDTFSVIAGTYSYMVTDANGCPASVSVTVTQPQPLFIGGNSSAVSCYGGNDGAINAATSGGTPAYTWLWNTGDTTEDLSNLPAGSYTVTITDANSCTFSTAINVTQPFALASAAGITNATGCATNNGSINLTPTGGTPGFSYTWSNGDTTQDITGLDGGSYSVTITDTNGCTHAATFTVTEPAAPTVTYSEPIDTTCQNPLLTFTLSGASPAGGTWSGPGVTGNMFDPGAASIGYNVINYAYTDSAGCSAAATDSIWVDVCMDIATPGVTNAINGYPNPTSGIFTVNAEVSAVITVYDILGNILLTQRASATKTEINISGFKDGVYMIAIAAGNQINTERIILIK